MLLTQVGACAALLLLVGTQAVPQDDDQPSPPCDDGLAHIPGVPEGARRPYSVRKRSKTVHREAAAASEDTPHLPPGRRRFDEVLPDEAGSDIKSAPPTRAQRRLAPVTDGTPEQEALPNERPVRRRRPAYPKKVITPREPEQGENYPPDHPAFRDANPKKDVVVDSYEAIRKYPTHQEDFQDNDVISVDRPIDQIAEENVSEERLQNAVASSDGDTADPDLPPGYHSKFPKRVFASDGDSSGDVLRLKPRKKANSYLAPAAVQPYDEELLEVAYRPEDDDQDGKSTPAPTRAPVQVYRGQQRFRASHRVRTQPSPSQAQFEQRRRTSIRRRPVTEAPSTTTASQVQRDIEIQEQLEPVTQVPQVPQVPARRRQRPLPSTVQQELNYPIKPRQRHFLPDLESDLVDYTETPVPPRHRPQRPVSSRGHGRRLPSGGAIFAQSIDEVEVEHDGSAKPHPKASSNNAAEQPDPALIQKIVKNTLRRLRPQIAEREGDVGVDILVKIIQLED